MAISAENISATRRPDRRRRRPYFILAATAVVLVVAALVTGGPIRRFFHLRKLRKCNVILITLDTTRADHLGCYDRSHDLTPNLDTLAASGTLFERCISQVPLTLPAHATILSGTYPGFHRVRDNGGFVVPEGLELVSETLGRRGYATSAFVAAYVLHSKWGLKQGWDLYNDTFRYKRTKTLSLDHIQKLAGEVLPEAEAWLKQKGKQRFFSWIHLYDPHSPYTPPEPYLSMHPGSPYQGEVAYMDAELGKFFSFLKAQGLWDNTLIVVTGDHGEMLGEHGESGHGFFIYEGAVHVPLIIRSPWPLPAHRVKTTVEHVDIVPTILEALGVPAMNTSQGRSLLGLAFGGSDKGSGRAHSETWYPRLHFGWSELTAIYLDGYKFIQAPQEELYDLAGGGKETDNLWLKKSAVRKKMRAALHDFQASVGRSSLLPENGPALSHEDREKLAALGYLSTQADSAADTVLIDPKTKIRVFDDMMRARGLQEAGEIGQAITLMEAIMANDPDIIDGRMLLANLYYKAKRVTEAVAAYREVIRRRPDNNFAMINLANTLIGMKQYAQAEREINAFRAIFPRDAAFLRLLGEVAMERQRTDEALEFFRQALALDPKHAEASLKMAEVYFQRQEMAKAETHLARAQELNPDLDKVAFLRAQAADARGDLELARTSYLRELEINEKNFSASFNLAQVCRKLGRNDEAQRYFRLTTEIQPAFNLPFFMIAKYDFDNRRDLDEAIAMCRRGVAIEPADRNTPLGYFLLADIYAYLGDPAKSKENYDRGQRLLDGLLAPTR